MMDSVLFRLQEVYVMAKNKHLTLEERFMIANLLDKQSSFKAIGAALEKDCTTISKEVRNHRILKRTGALGKAFNHCALRKTCDHRRLCSSCTSNRYCWSCKKCTSICKDFVEEKCSRLLSAPYVCNGCPTLKSCTLEKWFYHAAAADTEYRAVLSEAREGISLSEKKIQHLDAVISPLILKGQSINHICHNNKDSIMVSESTIYRLIDYNVFSARNIDLPRKVRYSKRRAKKHAKIDKQCRINRTYKDYQTFRSNNPDLPITEIDSVEGTKGGKVLLTIHFVKAEFMVAYLRDANDSQSVIDIFNRLYLELRCDRFMDLMPVLLADNGMEFSNPAAIESDGQDGQKTRVFYCDPSAPQQKGSAERNHELIRYCIPKGTSLDLYSQRDINLMMSHINSYCRPSLANKTPYEMMSFLYGEGIPELFGIQKIEPNEVILKPSVFQKGDTAYEP